MFEPPGPPAQTVVPAAASKKAPGFAVRPARPEDVAALLPLWQQMMAEHVLRHAAFALAEDANERWQEIMCDMLGRGHDSFVLLAELGATKIGYCSGWAAKNPPIYDSRRVGLISELAVAPTARRLGVGAALVAAARRWFHSRALEEFQLSTSVQNAGGRAFWRAVGGEELLVRYCFGVANPEAEPNQVHAAPGRPALRPE